MLPFIKAALLTMGTVATLSIAMSIKLMYAFDIDEELEEVDDILEVALSRA